MKNHTRTTTAPVSTAEFFPLPRNGTRDPVFGLSRSLLYALNREGEIRFVCLRRKGNVSGRVLVDCASVRAYLARLAKEQDRKRAETKPASATAAVSAIATTAAD
jgi:hypothetical protein